MDEQTTDGIEARENTSRQVGTGLPGARRSPGFWDRAADLLLSLPAGIGGRLGG